MNPPHAERASAPPTLTRRTPSAEMSCIVRSVVDPTNRLTGFGATAATTAVICSRVRMPGAYRQSAPACAYALSLLNRFAEIGSTHKKHSARPTSSVSPPV